MPRDLSRSPSYRRRHSPSPVGYRHGRKSRRVRSRSPYSYSRWSRLFSQIVSKFFCSWPIIDCNKMATPVSLVQIKCIMFKLICTYFILYICNWCDECMKARATRDRLWKDWTLLIVINVILPFMVASVRGILIFGIRIF